MTCFKTCPVNKNRKQMTCFKTCPVYSGLKIESNCLSGNNNNNNNFTYQIKINNQKNIKKNI